MTTTNNAVETVTINVFKDNEGDYLVTNAPLVAAGITAFQLSGPAVDADGGPLTVLDSMPGFILFINASALRDGEKGLVADIAAGLEYELVETSERPVTDKLAAALMQNNEA